MKKYLIVFILIFYNINSFSQPNKERKLESWIRENNIVFNSPISPEGFDHFLKCNNVHAYRKNIGDTIIIYSRGDAIAENVETLSISIKKPEFIFFPLSLGQFKYRNKLKYDNDDVTVVNNGK